MVAQSFGQTQDPKGRKRATSLGRSRALTVPAPTEVVNLDHRSG